MKLLAYFRTLYSTLFCRAQVNRELREQFRSHILRHADELVAQSFRLTPIGILAGLVDAFALTRFMASLLYSVSATDPLTFALILLVLSAAALIACDIAARSASKLDPWTSFERSDS